jgi:hypothetical protein
MSGRSSFRDCTEVTPACPVEATTYGYYPSLGPNATLLAVFAILLVAQAVIGLLKRVYWYSGAIAAGCLLEMLGYVGRLLMHENPWSDFAMRLQIVCLIIAPSFIAGGIYFTLKHYIRLNGPQHSLIRPSLYTWIFIGCDIGSICLQAVGGGIAGGATTVDTIEIGNNIIIAGIAFQVVTMAFCGVLTIHYSVRRFLHRSSKSESRNPGSGSARAVMFQGAVAFAFITVLIRCIYRIPEMAGGWGNPRMRDEPEFLILDGLMIALACVSLTVFHPGFFYPYMRTGYIDVSEPLPSSVELVTPSMFSVDQPGRAR